MHRNKHINMHLIVMQVPYACQNLQTFLSTPSRTRSRIAGTAVITVGNSTEASPFVPFFILLDVSVSVKGDPYPMAVPAAAITF